MSKKVIGIAAVIVVFIAIVVAVFTLNGKDTQEPTIDTSKMAGELDSYVPDMTKDEIKEQLEIPYTEEQQQIADEIFKINHVPEVDISQNIIVSDDGVATYTDVDGNTIEYELDQDILDMEDEDLEAETAAILAALNDPTFGEGKAPNTNTSNNENITSTDNNNQGNTGDLQEPTGSEAIGNAGSDDGDAPVGGYSSDPNSGFQQLIPGQAGSEANEVDEGAYSGWVQ